MRAGHSSGGRVFVYQAESPGFGNGHYINQMGWCVVVIPAHRKKKQDQNPKIILGYRSEFKINKIIL